MNILIMKKMTEMNRQQLPVILTGDFNGGPASEPIRYLSARLNDTRQFLKDPGGDTVGTFNGFDPSLPSSDHFPVVAEMRFEQAKKP